MKSSLALIVIATCIGVYFVYITPAIKDIKSLSLKKSEYTNVVLKAEELKQKRDAVDAEYQSIPKSDKDRLNKIIPDTFDGIVFANEMNALALQFNLKIASVKTEGATKPTVSRTGVTTSEPQKLYKTNAVNIRMTGSYSQFVKFLASLEANLRLADVVSVTVDSGASDPKLGGTDSFGYTVDLTVYSLK